MAQEQIKNAAGIVIKTHRKVTGQPSSFDIYDTLVKRQVTCYTELFLPVWDGDVVVGSVVDTGVAYRFDQVPQVTINVSEEEIIKSILKSQKFAMKREFAKKTYDAIIMAFNSLNVDGVLSELSIKYVEDQDDDSVTDLIRVTSMSESQIKKLLKWWYKTRLLRKLYLLGLNNTDIHNSKLPADKLYEQLVIDPFLVVTLSIDKCKNIYKILLRTYNDDQLFRAGIARKLYYNTVNKAWPGTPSKFLQMDFKDVTRAKITQHMDILRSEYGIKTDLATVYLKDQYEAEMAVFDILTKANSRPGVLAEYNIDPKDIIFDNSGLSDKQKELITVALTQSLSIGMGGAGTGKTTALKTLLHNLDMFRIPYITLSFTGKSVARIKEVIKKSSPMTIHMAILKRKKIPPFKIAIFDESSMITTELIYMLCKAFGTDFAMCFLGDIAQLPPISCGYFFDQLIKSEVVTPVVLDRNYRSVVASPDAINNIVVNTDKLIKWKPAPDGEYTTPFKFDVGNNFFMLEGNEETVYTAVKLLADRGIKGPDITVITPYVKNIDSLNKRIQQIFRVGNKSHTDIKGVTWAIGDRVMITQNNYSLNQMNGDEGIITDITDQPGPSGHHEMMVQFKSGHEFKFVITYEKKGGFDTVQEIGDSYVITSEPTVDILTHCYAITIHKSQGSEWDYVIFYVTDVKDFINKNLVITAITRPRKSIWIIGDIQGLEIHCVNNISYRHETLAMRIKGPTIQT